jgi:pimeloyl-ACP methyl ester carboxylesterase
VHGNKDVTVPIGTHAEPLNRQLPNNELTVLDGVGHMPHHTNTDAVVAAIDRVAVRAGLR